MNPAQQCHYNLLASWKAVIRQHNEWVQDLDHHPFINPFSLTVDGIYDSNRRHVQINIFNLRTDQIWIVFEKWIGQVEIFVSDFKLNDESVTAIPEVIATLFTFIHGRTCNFDVSGCLKLKQLPDFLFQNPNIAPHVNSIIMTNCIGLKHLPDSPGLAQSIDEIDISGSGLTDIPAWAVDIE
jgi:hypothetical protein